MRHILNTSFSIYESFFLFEERACGDDLALGGDDAKPASFASTATTLTSACVDEDDDEADADDDIALACCSSTCSSSIESSSQAAAKLASAHSDGT